MTITNELAQQVADFLGQGYSQDDASEKFGVSKDNVNKITNGTWQTTKRAKLSEDAVSASRKRQKKYDSFFTLECMIAPKGWWWIMSNNGCLLEDIAYVRRLYSSR